MKKYSRVLVANRGEVAIRVFRACTELGKRTIAIYSEEDSLALHRYKADEAYLVPSERGPVEAYLDIDAILALARRHRIDAIHPGYGFLSENAEFARRCLEAGIDFIGPTPGHLELFGDKLSSRAAALRAGVPVIPGTDGPVGDVAAALAFAREAGYPVIVKAAAGGGGRGMRVAADEEELRRVFPIARREAESSFGSGTVYLERFVEKPRHIEVQILGDRQGEVIHLWERDCSVQRRHQKVVEVAPAVGLDPALRAAICESARSLMADARYVGAGTAEFLVDPGGSYYFIEVNPRIQVEHTVTELVLGIDLVQAQIRIAEGHDLEGAGIPRPLPEPKGYAIQCRVTTEDPENDFLPDTGRIAHYRSPGGLGVRLDGATAFTGGTVSPHYDSLLVKVCTAALRFEDAARKMHRALLEFRIRGVKTNIPFLENVVTHPEFLRGGVDTGFIDTRRELFDFRPRLDRGTKILRYIGDIAVNGQRDGPKSRSKPDLEPAVLPVHLPVPAGEPLKALLDRDGPDAVARRVRASREVLLTDTTFRDAHQSLLATRMRTRDLLAASEATGRIMPGLFSMEVWGGATFDTAYRFLKEDPWDRLAQLRERLPGHLLQMLLRGQSILGYSAYPDNAVRAFVREAAAGGIDVFRIFDSLNWLPNMRVAIEAVRSEGKIAEGTLCYTGDLLDASRTKYDLGYYTDLAKELESAGVNTLAVKDMAGLLKPAAADRLVRALRDVTDLPIHLHTHDSTGVAVSVCAMGALAGADIVDGCIDALAGGTSQPSLRAIAAALEGTSCDPELDLDGLQPLNDYWAAVRRFYGFIEKTPVAPDAGVFRHQVPGGQFTNLKAQADAVGLAGRWSEVVRAYREADGALGELIKVTPSSKAVGDLALFMVQNGLDGTNLVSRGAELSFPESVVGLLKGRLGRPPYGFPEALRAAVLKGDEPLADRPGAYLAPTDLERARAEVSELTAGDPLAGSPGDREALSLTLFPDVYREYVEHRAEYGDTSVLDTLTFFYGLEPGERVSVEIEPGKTLIIRLLSIGEERADGTRPVRFELNGHSREVRVQDAGIRPEVVARPKADPAEWREVGASMPGRVVQIVVEAGESVEKGAQLLMVEAMKMETAVTAPRHAVVEAVAVSTGDEVEAGDLLVRLATVPETGEL